MTLLTQPTFTTKVNWFNLIYPKYSNIFIFLKIYQTYFLISCLDQERVFKVKNLWKEKVMKSSFQSRFAEL